MNVQGIATSDFQHLTELKLEASKDAKRALPEVARQFEGIFLQTMLKTMRMGQHFLDESSPFNGKNQATFQEMLDGQYVSTLTESKSVGLATMLAKQLEGSLVNQEKPSADSTKDIHATTGQSAIQMKDTQEQSGTNTVDDFVKSLWPKARQAASMMGLDPKILIAQAALETGWGKHIAKGDDGTSSNNLFNIKATPNSKHDSVSVKTTEYIADTPLKMTASFRKYPSVEQSFNDYVSLIQGSERYQEAVANASNPERYVNELHKAGYATDPKYGSKILSIYHGDELNQAIERCGLSDQI